MHVRRWVTCTLLVFVASFVAPPTARSIPITTWGYTITQSNATYELTGDLTEPSGSQGTDGSIAIFILPSIHDVVIDGQGFTIDGLDSAGVPDADVGVRIIGLSSGPVRDVRIQNLRFTDVAAPIVSSGDLCNLLVEACEIDRCNGDALITIESAADGASLSWLTVRDNWIHDSSGLPILIANTGNLGTNIAGMSHIYIVANAIVDNRRALGGGAAWNAGIVLRHGAEDVRVWDNLVVGGSDLAGVVLDSGDDIDNVFDDVSIRGNHLTGNTGSIRVPGSVTASGLTLAEVTTSTSDFSSWQVSGNYFYQNEEAGLEHIPGANSPASLAADGNWWGEDFVVAGTFGNGAIGATDASPGDLPNGILVLPDRGEGDRALSNGGAFLAHVYLINQENSDPSIRGWDLDYDFATHLAFLRSSEGPFLAAQASATQFFDIPRTGGTGNERTASCAILGATPGAVGNGALSVVVFKATAEELGAGDDVFIDGVLLRDPMNDPVNVGATWDADRRVDDTPPVVFLIPPDGNPCVGGDTALVDLFVTDSFALEDVFVRSYKIDKDPGCWQPLQLDISGTFYTGPSPIEVDVSCCDGEYIVEVCATDDAGNVLLEQLTLIHDTTPPPDFTGTVIAATSQGNGTPALDEIEVSWSGTFEVDGDLKLRFLPFGGSPGFFAHPEYDDEPGATPHFPLPGEGTEFDVPDVAAGSAIVPFPIAERSFYYFVLAVEDCAGNQSEGSSPDAQANALSYYLGDWDSSLPPVCAGSPEFDSGSGTVDFCDVIGFSLGFDTIEGDTDYHAELDIGPTTPGPGVFDLPTTDNIIDFEDLILLAINFGSVLPRPGGVELAQSPRNDRTGTSEQTELGLATSGTSSREDPSSEASAVARPFVRTTEVDPRLGLGEPQRGGARFVIPLKLIGNESQVKGFVASIEHDARRLQLVSVRKAEGIGDDVILLTAPRAHGVTSINVAVLGRERVFLGSGPVVELVFDSVQISRSGSGSIDADAVRLGESSLRDALNRDVARLATLLADDRAAGAGASSASAAASGGAQSARRSDQSGLPVAFALSGPHPNPFNPRTSLRVALPEARTVSVSIYSAGGRLIRSLTSGQLPAGEHEVVWDGRTMSGAEAPSGLYLADIHAGPDRAVRKLVLTR